MRAAPLILLTFLLIAAAFMLYPPLHTPASTHADRAVRDEPMVLEPLLAQREPPEHVAKRPIAFQAADVNSL
jgi:hypothetical protein